MTRKKLLDLIVASNYGEAIAALRGLESDDDWQSQLTLLEGQYQSLLRDRRQGILSADESNLQENRLRKHLHDLVQDAFQQDLIEAATPEEFIYKQQQNKQRTYRQAGWLAATILCVGIAAYFMINRDQASGTAAEKPVQTQVTRSDSSGAVKNVPAAAVKGNEKPVSRPAPTSAPLPAMLKVTATPEEFQSLFTTQAGKWLNKANIPFQAGGNKNGPLIHCTFQLKKTKTQSGVREAFKYSLSCNVQVTAADGTVCPPRSYHSKNARIGYPEDSEDDIITKIIEPGLLEIENSFMDNPPQLCNK